MTKRRPDPQPEDNEYIEAAESIELSPDDTILPADQTPLDKSEIQAEYDAAFPDNPPTDDDLNAEYYRRTALNLVNALRYLKSEPSWDNAFFQSRQSELMEQQIEALQQVLQVARTTTFVDENTLADFLGAIIELCESLPPVIASVCMVKLIIRDNRPK